jgi:hypothetical protein
MMNFEQTPEFKKDLKRLLKKWRSLPIDIEVAERNLVPLYVPQPDVDLMEFRKAFFNRKRAAIILSNNMYEVVKMRLDVECIGRSDKVRVIFVAVNNEHTIRFIELYTKNEKEREDLERIRKYS